MNFEIRVSTSFVFITISDKSSYEPKRINKLNGMIVFGIMRAQMNIKRVGVKRFNEI